MHARLRLAALALLAVAVGCADHDPSSPGGPAGGGAGPEAVAPDLNPSPEARRLERQANRLARALADPALRGYVYAQLQASPVVEHKLQFQRFLDRDDRRLANAMASAGGEPAAAVMADAAAGIAAELYLPVPGHLQRWQGGPDFLVATALRDGDVPVAYNARGERLLLDPRNPPPTPVIALVPQEADFDRPPRPDRAICEVDDCGGEGNGTGGGGSSGGGAGGGSGGGPGGTPPSQSLYLTKAQFVDTFEGIRDREAQGVHFPSLNDHCSAGLARSLIQMQTR